MSPTKDHTPEQVRALTVRQWLPEWDKIKFDPKQYKKKPNDHFYLFSLPAQALRKLTGIYRRSTAKARVADLGIQRRHDPTRSDEIGRYIHSGYPWSALKDKDKNSGLFEDLYMPGWLPTAIVVNILSPNTERNGKVIATKDLIKITKAAESSATLMLPEGYSSPEWNPEVEPIEVIDGQHRLWAFDPSSSKSNTYELPVVAFYGLDVSWQAYLFWTINIKPKRINPSFAFDLYPLLRTQDWLERFEGPRIYREARAQELTEIMWSHSESPWRDRINMLGESGSGTVTQASFIRSLMASYVKSSEGVKRSIGGLFGSRIDSSDVLPWSRSQQAAFLILVWKLLQDAVTKSKAPWATSLRGTTEFDLFGVKNSPSDPAFAGRQSLLATDQGVRGVLQVTNDLSFLQAEALHLRDWIFEAQAEEVNEDIISDALKSLKRRSLIVDFLESMTSQLTKFDWRSSSASGLSEAERKSQMIFKGSSGYKEIRRQLLQTLTSSKDRKVRDCAQKVIDELGY